MLIVNVNCTVPTATTYTLKPDSETTIMCISQIPQTQIKVQVV
jgi:hypothetical protein